MSRPPAGAPSHQAALDPVALDPVVLGAWARRLTNVAGEVAAVAADVGRKGTGPGLAGPAGDALARLLDRLSRQVLELGRHCDDAARSLAAEAVQVQAVHVRALQAQAQAQAQARAQALAASNSTHGVR